MILSTSRCECVWLESRKVWNSFHNSCNAALCTVLVFQGCWVLKKLENQTSRQQETAEETCSNLAEGTFSRLPFDVSESLCDHSAPTSLWPTLLLHPLYVFPVPIWTNWNFLRPGNPACTVFVFRIQTSPGLFLRCCVLCLSTATKLGNVMQPTFALRNKQGGGPEKETSQKWALPFGFCMFFHKPLVSFESVVCQQLSASVLKIALLLFCSVTLKCHQFARQIFIAQTNLHLKKRHKNYIFSRNSSLQKFPSIFNFRNFQIIPVTAKAVMFSWQEQHLFVLNQ